MTDIPVTGDYEIGARVLNKRTGKPGVITKVGPVDYITVQYQDGTVESNTTFYFSIVNPFDASQPRRYQTRPRVQEDLWNRQAPRRSGLAFSNFEGD
jgi:hypothetical protein